MVTPIVNLLFSLHILLLFPGVNVSTREAYALVDSTLQEDLSQTDVVSVFVLPHAHLYVITPVRVHVAGVVTTP